MEYDIVVVGGGIGGLTVAALLAARGVNICLLERQSQVGGCIARVEFSGYEFEPGMGIYTDWGPGEVYEQLFSELPVEIPAAKRIEADYVVRVFGDYELSLKSDKDEFNVLLRKTFPECGDAAVEFYAMLDQARSARTFESQKPRFARGLRNFWRGAAPDLDAQRVVDFLSATSPRFQHFLNAQLRAIAQSDVDHCDLLTASYALNSARRAQYIIENGIAALAERLAETIKRCGGSLRLNCPVLRLAYDERGRAIGIDLLSGERVLAKHAIISNLTIWDTYGKLVGLNRTPPEVKQQLARIETGGVYVIYAVIDEATVSRLPAKNFLVALPETNGSDKTSTEFTVSISERSVNGNFTVTIKTASEVAPWFSFQASEDEFEARDQSALEESWEKLHRSLPELGSGIEIIETANPRTYYDLTRRKLGMVLGTNARRAPLKSGCANTSIPNLFMVGDTVSPHPSVASVVRAAIDLASQTLAR